MPEWLPESVREKIDSPDSISRCLGNSDPNDAENPKVVLLGDSLAASLHYGLVNAEVYVDAIFSSFGCSLDNIYMDPSRQSSIPHCVNQFRKAKSFLSANKIAAVVLADTKGSRTVVVNEVRKHTDAPIIFFTNWPLLRSNGPEIWAYGRFPEDSGFVKTPKSSIVISGIFSHLNHSFKRVIVIDVTETLCTDELCDIGTDKGPFFWDRRHLTTAGSAEIIRRALAGDLVLRKTLLGSHN